MSRHKAVLTHHADGTVTVQHADPVIWLSRKLLDPDRAVGVPEQIQLDTAGEYVYRFVGWRPWPAPEEEAIYERVVA